MYKLLCFVLILSLMNRQFNSTRFRGTSQRGSGRRAGGALGACVAAGLGPQVRPDS